MNYLRCYILTAGLLFSVSLIAQSKNDSVFKKEALHSFYLTPTSANKKEIINESAKPLILFIFLSPECPLCKRYAPFLKKLHDQFKGDVEFYGIVPGKAYTISEIKNYRVENEIAFPLLMDDNKRLSDYLQASVTPEVILLNRDYQLVYKGAIDNLMAKLGKQRIHATESFLQKAIWQSLNSEQVSVKRTKAVGCGINDY